jgi:ribose transport system substrate-binding protein
MTIPKLRRPVTALPVIAVAAVLGLAACGSSSSSSSGGSGSSGGSTSSANTTSSANVTAAKAVIAPFSTHPSAFEVTTPLGKKLPAGTQFAYLQCVTPICGLFKTLLTPAVAAIGGKLTVIPAGASTASLQSSMSTIIQQKPKALLLPAIEPDSINTQLHQAEQAGIKISSNGVMNAAKYGISAAQFNVSTSELAGKLMAAWAVAQKGSGTNVVFYATPELSFSQYMQNAFGAEMKALCPKCSVRDVVISVATIGNSAPSRVVSDLQTNPNTNVAVFATNEAATGLPAALKGAGITGIDTIGFGPTPANLQDIKTGGQTAGLGLDFATMSWTQVDAAARLILGIPLTPGEKAGVPPLQFLTASNLSGNLAQGWAGYPDFPARFAKLWGS